VSDAPTTMKPRVSVVIPAFNRSELLGKAVRSLFHQDLAKDEYEVLVVDSSPNDDNRLLIESLQAEAPFALRGFTKEPEGPGPSRNLGVREARADVIAFMDSDCQADPAWLRTSLAVFDEGVGIVQGKTRPNPQGEFSVFTRYPWVESENFVYECTNILYTREAFEAAGGFPRDLNPRSKHPLGGEDVELAWKVKRLGWQTRFADESIMYHEVFRISIWNWFFTKQMYVWPYLTKQFPELRKFFVFGIFWDHAQALLVLALAGAALAFVTPWALLLMLPYVYLRGSPASRSFPGLMRPLRVLPYLGRDGMWLLLMLAGSIRYRCLLL